MDKKNNMRKSSSPAKEHVAHRNHYVQWTLAEIAFVEKHYGKLPAREIATTLGRGVAAVRSMALKIGVGSPGAKPWDMWEINIMKKHYSHGAGIAMVRALLLHRDMESIRKQAARAGLTDVRDAIAFLREHYGHMPVEEVAAALDKSVSAVRNRANVLKLGKTQLSRWTREENAILTGHYGNSGNLDAIHSLLPHRSRKAIEAQAAKLGLTRSQIWTPEEISILQQLYPILGRKLTRVLPGKTNSAIHHQAEKLGLRRYAKKHSGKPEHEKG